eukprot:6887812-Alexandrium_andersonii.AAC.1
MLVVLLLAAWSSTRMASRGSPSSSPPRAMARTPSPTVSSTCCRTSPRGRRSTRGVGSTSDAVVASESSCEGGQNRELVTQHISPSSFDDALMAHSEGSQQHTHNELSPLSCGECDASEGEAHIAT